MSPWQHFQHSSYFTVKVTEVQWLNGYMHEDKQISECATVLYYTYIAYLVLLTFTVNISKCIRTSSSASENLKAHG